MFTAQVKRALWLLRHQQLGYMTQLQRQLLEVLLQQWSRTELIQVGMGGVRKAPPRVGSPLPFRADRRCR